MRTKKRCTNLLILGIFMCLAFAAVVGANPAPDPSAFTFFETHGITSTPVFESGITQYTLQLDAGAYLVYNAVQYPITLIWGYYAVNKTGLSANDFTASGSDISDWTWDQKPNTGTLLSVGGWLNAPKNEALTTPGTGSVTKIFNFSGLTYSGIDPLLGLHVSVSIPSGMPSPFGGGNSGNISIVPEPSSLVALFCGSVGIIFRKLKR